MQMQKVQKHFLFERKMIKNYFYNYIYYNIYNYKYII